MSTDPESLDADEAGCSLYLLSPHRLEPGSFAAQLDAALSGGGSAAFLLRSGAGTRQLAAAALRPVCRAREVAFLIEDDLDLALAVEADGVHLLAADRVAVARERLGRERIIGASCGVSRDRAMSAGEAGADYVAFGDPGRPANRKLLETVAWWSELFVLPCLALGTIDAHGYPDLVRAGADFLGVGDAVWDHPEGPAAAVRVLQDAIRCGDRPGPQPSAGGGCPSR